MINSGKGAVDLKKKLMDGNLFSNRIALILITQEMELSRETQLKIIDCLGNVDEDQKESKAEDLMKAITGKTEEQILKKLKDGIIA